MDNKSLFILKDFKGLGTLWFIELFLHDRIINEDEVRSRLEFEIKDFERKYSRFNDNSLLNKLNKNKEVDFDEDLAKMLSLSKDMTAKSDGVFNVFIKERLEDKGYGNKPDGVSPKKIENDSFTEIMGDKIILIGNKGIDLGGIGKGYLIDKLAKILIEDFKIKYFVINGGGDIYVTSNYGEEVEIFLEHPTKPDEYINKIKIKNKAFCASSSFKRMWLLEDKEVNHFIGDDKEGEVWASSYVVGENATTTDMFATVACILSLKEEKLKKITEGFSLEYLVINEFGEIYKTNGFEELLK